uniref:SKA complex subunit 1 n=2 Tax=Arion vulgaris TaxID=1028688 RepID=A0A0B6ZGH2_9EUPU
MEMNTNSIEDLTQHFLRKLSILKNAVILSNATADQSFLDVKYSLAELLDRVKLLLRSMRRDVDIAKEQLQGYEDMKIKYCDFIQHLQFAITNIPLKLATKKCLHGQLIPQVIATDQCRMDYHLKSNVHQTTRSCNYLDFLTVYEFEAIPKYMKGRLTYEKMNTIIEQLDKVFSEKYQVLKQKTASLSDVNRKRVELFRVQENKDTEGIPFVTEKDITDLSSMKVDNSVRNMMTILRHCNILQEIRGGGYVRFAIASRF